jgi:hypothetical protein
LELRDFLTHAARWTKPTLDPKSFGAFKYSTPVTPIQYLNFAEKDLRLGGPRGLVNALTNSKRAIDCLIYNLLSSLGMPEPYSFPARLEALHALGLLAPRIVRKIVQLRNVLEHEYYLPKVAEVEDAYDVTALFIATIKPYFAGGSYMESAWIADEVSTNPRGEFTRTSTHTIWRHDSEPEFTYSRGIYVQSEIGDKKIDLDLVHDNIKVGEITIAPKDASYVELQGLLLRAEVEDFAYSRVGAKRFLKALRAAAP